MAEISSFEGSPKKIGERIIINVQNSGRVFRINHVDDNNTPYPLQETRISIGEDVVILYFNPTKFAPEITGGRDANFRIYSEIDAQPILNVGCQEFPLDKLNRYYKEVCDIRQEEISSANKEVTYIKKNNTSDSSYVKNPIYAENDETFIVKYSDGRLKSFLKSEYSVFKKESASRFKYTPGTNRVLLRKDGTIKLGFGGYNEVTYTPNNIHYQKIMNSYINGVKYFMDLMAAAEAIKKEIYETK